MTIDVKNNGTIHDTVKFLGSGKVIVHPGAQIRHYSVIEMHEGFLEIGRGSVLGFFTMVQCTGDIRIGQDTMIGPHCTLLASFHEMSLDPNIQKKLTRSTLRFGDNVWSGANVTFNCGIDVASNSVIGANSFVNDSVPTSAIVAGSPAKLIRWKDDA